MQGLAKTFFKSAADAQNFARTDPRADGTICYCEDGTIGYWIDLDIDDADPSIGYEMQILAAKMTALR